MRKIIPFIFLIVFIPSIILAEEYTIIKDGIVWTRVHQGELSKALDDGKVKKKIDGEWVNIKKMKEIDYLKLKEEPAPESEDIDNDGNTDFVKIRIDTKEKIKE